MYINLITIDLCPGQSGGGVTPSGTLTISENGVYDVYSYASASVNVPSPQFVTESLSVSANGTYTPGQGVDGYSQVVVDVPQSVTGYTDKDITEKNYDIINLNNSASFVSNYAFYNSGIIQTVNLPYATIIYDNAFGNCYSLSQVSLPVCNYLAFGVFQACYSLSQVSLPMCAYIDNQAFYGCNSLSNVNLPMCSYIGWYAFTDCISLNQITIGYSSMCSLNGYDAFTNTSITSSTGSIYVPASLVDAYKSAENWSYFSTQIFPISE